MSPLERKAAYMREWRARNRDRWNAYCRGYMAHYRAPHVRLETLERKPSLSLLEVAEWLRLKRQLAVTEI